MRILPLTTVILLLLAWAFVAGCGSVGKDFNSTALSSIEPGMTEDEVSSALGAKPFVRTYRSDYSYTATWVHVQVVGFGTVRDNRSLKIDFDSDGRMLLINTTKNIDPPPKPPDKLQDEEAVHAEALGVDR
jgi:hypothetical protein